MVSKDTVARPDNIEAEKLQVFLKTDSFIMKC